MSAPYTTEYKLCCCMCMRMRDLSYSIVMCVENFFEFPLCIFISTLCKCYVDIMHKLNSGLFYIHPVSHCISTLLIAVPTPFCLFILSDLGFFRIFLHRVVHKFRFFRTFNFFRCVRGGLVAHRVFHPLCIP